MNMHVWGNDFDFRQKLPGTDRAGFIIHCSKCSHSEQMQSLPKGQTIVERHFRQRGWDIGVKRQKDLCPTCSARPGREKKLTAAEVFAPKPQEPVVNKPVMIELQDQLPAPEPTREERRSVFDALDKAYDITKQRYCAGENDAAVAKRLDVPRIMVERIRDEFFGPPGSEEDAKLRDEMTALRGTFILAEAQLTAALEQLAEAEKRLKALETKMEKR